MGRQLAPLFTIFTVKSGALSDIYLLTIFMTQGLLVFFMLKIWWRLLRGQVPHKCKICAFSMGYTLHKYFIYFLPFSGRIIISFCVFCIAFFPQSPNSITNPIWSTRLKKSATAAVVMKIAGGTPWIFKLPMAGCFLFSIYQMTNCRFAFISTHWYFGHAPLPPTLIN